MTKSVTNRQLVFILLIVLVEPAIYVPGLLSESAGIGSWVTLILTSIVFAVAAVLIIKLNSMYKGKMLFDYSGEIIGKTGAYILGFFFILYFFSTTSFLLASFTNTLKNNFLLKTPAWFEMLAGLPVFGYAAYKGLTNIARMTEIVGVIFIFTAVWIHIAMLMQGNVENIMPPYNPYETGKYLAAVKDAVVLFLGIEILTIVPFTQTTPKKTMKAAFFSVFSTGVIYILIVVSSIMMIGMEETQNYTDPTIAAIRTVEIPFIEFLTRIDMVYLTVGFSGFIVFIIIQYCAVVEYASKVFPKVKRLVIVIAVGAILFILGSFASGIDDLRDRYAEYAVFLIPFASVIIPVFLLIAAKVKKNAQKMR